VRPDAKADQPSGGGDGGSSYRRRSADSRHLIRATSTSRKWTHSLGGASRLRVRGRGSLPAGQVMRRIAGASSSLGRPGGRFCPLRALLLHRDVFHVLRPSTLGGDVVPASISRGRPATSRAFNSVCSTHERLVVLSGSGGRFVLFPQYRRLRPSSTPSSGSRSGSDGAFSRWWLAPWLVRVVLPPTHRVRRSSRTTWAVLA